MAPPNVVLFLR